MTYSFRFFFFLSQLEQLCHIETHRELVCNMLLNIVCDRSIYITQRQTESVPSRCWDLHCHSGSPDWLPWGRKDQPAPLHILSSRWSWPHAGHGIWTTDSQNCGPDQGKTNERWPGSKDFCLFSVLCVLFFFLHHQIIRYALLLINILYFCCSLLSRTGRPWCGVPPGLKRFASWLRTFWRTMFRSTLEP